ncbi:MAG: hypothetical protein IPK13_07120 [Deltaproteobacteria bacterium]|nr:hypothetical protein [Deltaproteobacteria bacterium]
MQHANTIFALFSLLGAALFLLSGYAIGRLRQLSLLEVEFETVDEHSVLRLPDDTTTSDRDRARPPSFGRREIQRTSPATRRLPGEDMVIIELDNVEYLESPDIAPRANPNPSLNPTLDPTPNPTPSLHYAVAIETRLEATEEWLSEACLEKSRLEDEVAKLELDRKHLEQSLMHARRDNEALRERAQRADSLTSRQVTLRADVVRLTERAERAEAEARSAAKALKDAAAEVGRLNIAARQRAREQAAVEAQCWESERRLEATAAKLAEAEKRQSDADQTCRRLAEELADLRRKHEESETQLAEAKARVVTSFVAPQEGSGGQGLATRVASLAELKDQHDRNLRALGDFERARTLVGQLRLENDALRVALQSARANHESLLRRNRHLEEENSRTRGLLIRLRAQQGLLEPSQDAS